MELRLSGSPGEIRIALLQHNTLLDVAIWRPGAPDGWGDIHDVRITAIAPSLDGAFIQTEGGQEAFLTTRKKPIEGSLLCAQLIRCAQNKKGARFKPCARPHQAPPATSPRLLQRGPTPLEELAHRHPHAPIYVDDMAVAALLPPSLRERIERIQYSFDTILENEWDDLLLPSFSLGALTAHFSPTPALTAIDLDTTSRPDFTSNTACFLALLRQIRLRNLSGIILIDPAGVKSRKRPALVPFLREAVINEADPMQPHVTGITPTGLLELTRPRRRPPLHDLMTSPHGRALAILRHVLRNNQPGTILEAPADLIYALEQDPTALAEFTRARCQPITLHVATRSSTLDWTLS